MLEHFVEAVILGRDYPNKQQIPFGNDNLNIGDSDSGSILRGGETGGIPQGLKPHFSRSTERAKPKGLAYLEAKERA
jgi:hypothetical protein